MIRGLNLILVAVAVTAALSVIAVGEALAVPRACCLANGTCEILTRAVCEDQRGGVSQTIGTDCGTVECPVLCGGSAPTCDGECDAGMICIEWLDSAPQANAGKNGDVQCGCATEVPLGGACDPLADACAPGLSCLNGVCAIPRAGAPALSPVSLVALVGILVAIGGATLVRRRRDT
jgi:hypothetical protein